MQKAFRSYKPFSNCIIHLVTDDGLYDQKAFYTVRIVFYSSSIIWVIVINFFNFQTIDIKVCFQSFSRKLISKGDYWWVHKQVSLYTNGFTNGWRESFVGYFFNIL